MSSSREVDAPRSSSASGSDTGAATANSSPLLLPDVRRSDACTPDEAPATANASESAALSRWRSVRASIGTPRSPIRRSASESLAEVIKGGNATAAGGWAVIRDFAFRGREWHWLNTISFWIAITFIEGSVLFVVGSAASATGCRDVWMRLALISGPNLAGSLLYSAGAYLGWYEVLNVGRSPRVCFAGPSRAHSASGYFATLCYFVGAVLYVVNTATAFLFPAAPPTAVLLLEWLPAVAASALFCLGALFEFYHNLGDGPETRAFWVCLYYLLGSICFLAASLCGLALVRGDAERLFRLPREEATVTYVDMPYLLGSLLFLVGAWAQLRMWKNDQFGLAFIRDVNMRLAFLGRGKRNSGRISGSDDGNGGGNGGNGGDKGGSGGGSGFECAEQFFHAVFTLLGATTVLNISVSYAFNLALEDAAFRHAALESDSGDAPILHGLSRHVLFEASGRTTDTRYLAG